MKDLAENKVQPSAQLLCVCTCKVCACVRERRSETGKECVVSFKRAQTRLHTCPLLNPKPKTEAATTDQVVSSHVADTGGGEFEDDSSVGGSSAALLIRSASASRRLSGIGQGVAYVRNNFLICVKGWSICERILIQVEA